MRSINIKNILCFIYAGAISANRLNVGMPDGLWLAESHLLGQFSLALFAAAEFVAHLKVAVLLAVGKTVGHLAGLSISGHLAVGSLVAGLINRFAADLVVVGHLFGEINPARQN